MIDIYKEKIPLVVQQRLTRVGYEIGMAKTIKHLLDWFLFSNSVRVYIVERIPEYGTKTPLYEVMMEDLDPINHMNGEPVKIRQADNHDELTAYKLGLTNAVQYCFNHQWSSNRQEAEGYIHIGLLGNFDPDRWWLLREALNLQSSKKIPISVPFEFDGVAILPKMAQRIVDYVQFVLDIPSDYCYVQLPTIDPLTEVANAELKQ